MDQSHAFHFQAVDANWVCWENEETISVFFFPSLALSLSPLISLLPFGSGFFFAHRRHGDGAAWGWRRHDQRSVLPDQRLLHQAIRRALLQRLSVCKWPSNVLSGPHSATSTCSNAR